MKLWFVILFVAFAAMCASVSGFGDEFTAASSCDTRDDTPNIPSRNRSYLNAGAGNEYCFEVEVVCKGKDEIYGSADVMFDADLGYPADTVLFVRFGAYEVGNDDNVCSTVGGDYPIVVGITEREWSMKCSLEGRNSFELTISPVINKYCEI